MKKKIGRIIWFTGLSGSGKSTLANSLKKYLVSLKYKVLIVDGDKFRKKTKNSGSFTKKNILINNISIINFIRGRQFNYDYILVAVISPLRNSRNKARKLFMDKYSEIFTKCSIKNLKKRDTKGLYKLADQRKITNLIGYKSKIKYERSNYKVIIIDTSKYNIKKTTEAIFKKL
tara:strand:- start:1279 stop:1800 length:522 start_codon:yes stop_codon:yes gene_type:complete